MLQQTTVTATIPYYEIILKALSQHRGTGRCAAGIRAGRMGRAWLLRPRPQPACLRPAVVAAGGFPRDLEGLRALPGIGVYTAAAVGAIAFGLPAVPVDGNVERVVARLFAVEEALPAAKPTLRALAGRLGSDPAAMAQPSDFAQALFDLGATVCTPAAPTCVLCPWMVHCAGRRDGIADATAAARGEAAAAVTAWRAFLAGGRRGQCAAAPSADAGAARRHDGIAGNRVAWRRRGMPRRLWHTRRWMSRGSRRARCGTASRISNSPSTCSPRGWRGSRRTGFHRPIGALAHEALPSVMRKCVRMAQGSVSAT